MGEIRWPNNSVVDVFLFLSLSPSPPLPLSPSLSPFIHFMVVNSNFLTINKTKGSIGPMLKHLHLSSIELKLTVGDCQPSK